MNQIIGYIILAIPFIGVFEIGRRLIGIEIVSLMFVGELLMCGLVYLGVYLIIEGD